MSALAEIDLITEGMALVREVARRIARKLGGHVPIDDLTGIGNLALLEVARTYDPGRSSFVAYASCKIKWMIFDGLRKETHGRSAAARVSAVMASERFGETAAEAFADGPTTQEQDEASLARLLDGHAAALALGLLAGSRDTAMLPDGGESPEEQLSRAEFADLVTRKVQELPDREREIIERHYWLGERFDLIARDLGISKSWASRLHEKAIAVLSLALTQLERRVPATETCRGDRHAPLRRPPSRPR